LPPSAACSSPSQPSAPAPSDGGLPCSPAGPRKSQPIGAADTMTLRLSCWWCCWAAGAAAAAGLLSREPCPLPAPLPRPWLPVAAPEASGVPVRAEAEELGPAPAPAPLPRWPCTPLPLATAAVGSAGRRGGAALRRRPPLPGASRRALALPCSESPSGVPPKSSLVARWCAAAASSSVMGFSCGLSLLPVWPGCWLLAGCRPGGCLLRAWLRACSAATARLSDAMMLRSPGGSSAPYASLLRQ
jgi:hypothetical protein